MNILPDTEKIYADFKIFGEKIIKMHFLKQRNGENIFIDIGIIYPEITLKTASANALLKNKKNFDEYLNILSLQEVENPDIKDFLLNPSLFNNYFFLVKKEEEVAETLESILNSNKTTSLYIYNKSLNEIEKFINFLSKEIKEKIRIIDAVNIISVIQYNNLNNPRTRLTFLKDSVSGRM